MVYKDIQKAIYIVKSQRGRQGVSELRLYTKMLTLVLSKRGN